ncbi:micrococcal nuclease [Microbulbifer yueqingensis]|uniref:Micrococcal nuclease n=1 Tax=Microbulbifer yueqingensis TaxID=658219 RepID=A0A1G9EG25_9GAMM|nr:micrococcal nuclease [Microbulbifer yueqingensis]
MAAGGAALDRSQSTFHSGERQPASEILSAEVIRIVDGDTIHIQGADKQPIKIRLAGIDCPERDQPWGDTATRALSRLVTGQVVDIAVVDIDRYGRTVGRVFLRDQNINRVMVKAGNCWAYTRYVRDSKLLELEKEAQLANRGLWSQPKANQIPPWEWRRHK